MKNTTLTLFFESEEDMVKIIRQCAVIEGKSAKKFVVDIVQGHVEKNFKDVIELNKKRKA